MDEAEKYKQRLEAIAEKRRLLEEQERAKRDMEDERLRLQQLKRKSLRDQWLMEGPPLSPSPSDPPHSPLWGTQAQEIEKRIEKLESQAQHLAETDEKLKDVMEDGQIQETMVVDKTATEITQDAVHNGKNVTELGEDIVTENPQSDKVILTNGAGETEEEISEAALVINGLSDETKSVQVNADNNVADDDDEDGTMVIRAECIMIVDESDEMTEEPTKENGCHPLNATSIPDEAHSKTDTESAQSEGTVSVEAGQPESAVAPNDTQGDELEESTVAQLQSQADGGPAVAPVPIYTETQPCVMTTPQAEAEGEDTHEEERIEVSSKAMGSVTVEFQEVPLSAPQDRKAPCEQEPLLTGIKAKNADLSNPNNQTETPDRADQAEAKAPKRKTCQCCSVM